jgi:transcription elongation factor GreB
MNKAFTKETDHDEDDGPALPPIPAGGKNYITPQGYARLRTELLQLMDEERPRVVEVVHWAASNGDRSENGDYLYGKKRLREIDRRIRFLTKRLEIAEVVDPSLHAGSDQVFFGATVRYVDDLGEERCITIMGVDEADSSQGQVSWVAPGGACLAQAPRGGRGGLAHAFGGAPAGGGGRALPAAWLRAVSSQRFRAGAGRVRRAARRGCGAGCAGRHRGAAGRARR